MSYKSLASLVSIVVIAATALATAAAPASAASGTTHYVDCNASTNGSGTQASPWNSTAAVDAVTFQPGDSILFDRGTTCDGSLAPQGSGSAGAAITVGAYGTGTLPVIAAGASATAAFELSDQSYWTVEDLQITGGVDYGVYVTGNTAGAALTNIDFWQYLWNTLLLAVPYATLITLTSALVGFGFARLRARGRSGLFILMLATSMVPQILTVIPTYVLFTRIHLVDTRWPWVLWGLAASPFLAFLFRQFFASLPTELEDAAILDGCGWLRIFARIFLPLSKPVLATSFILSFTWVWGDFFTPEIFLNDDKTTLAVAMGNGYTDPATNAPLTNVMAAGTMFYVLPVLLVFFFAQRSFVRGIATTGLKG